MRTFIRLAPFVVLLALAAALFFPLMRAHAWTSSWKAREVDGPRVVRFVDCESEDDFGAGLISRHYEWKDGVLHISVRCRRH